LADIDRPLYRILEREEGVVGGFALDAEIDDLINFANEIE
jgi:hypothetical protein